MTRFLAPSSALAARLFSVGLAEVALSSLVCIVVWALCRALRGRWPALQQSLWALVLLRLLLPPGLAHPYGLGALLARFEPTLSSTGDGVAGSPETVDCAGGDCAGPAEASATRSAWPLVAVAGWAIAGAMLAVRRRRRVSALRDLLGAARPVTDARVLRLLERWRRHLGIRRQVRLLSAETRVSPFTLGSVRPLVFLPAVLLESGRQRALATALAHELAHVARWDCLVRQLQQWLQGLYFFHPAVWIAAGRLRAGQEQMSDALVVSHGLVSARRYVGGLLDVLQLDLRGAEAPALTHNQRRLLMRIDAVRAVRPRQRSRSLLAFFAAALVGVFLRPLAAGGSPSQTAAGGQAPSSRELANPLPSGHLTLGFGATSHPITRKPYAHRGIDLAAPAGTPVLAPADGVVEVATADYAPSKDAGSVVVLKHPGGLTTFCAHLGSIEVAAGQRVSRGETIGRVGTSGLSTGPHLHFEVWRGGAHLDPAHFFPEWTAAAQADHAHPAGHSR